jgi:hypothetical protein
LYRRFFVAVVLAVAVAFVRWPVSIWPHLPTVKRLTWSLVAEVQLEPHQYVVFAVVSFQQMNDGGLDLVE